MIAILGPNYRRCEQFIRATFPYYSRATIVREFLCVYDAHSRDKLHGLERGLPYIDIGASSEVIEFAKAREMRAIYLKD